MVSIQQSFNKFYLYHKTGDVLWCFFADNFQHTFLKFVGIFPTKELNPHLLHWWEHSLPPGPPVMSITKMKMIKNERKNIQI